MTIVIRYAKENQIQIIHEFTFFQIIKKVDYSADNSKKQKVKQEKNLIFISEGNKT